MPIKGKCISKSLSLHRQHTKNKPRNIYYCQPCRYYEWVRKLNLILSRFHCHDVGMRFQSSFRYYCGPTKEQLIAFYGRLVNGLILIPIHNNVAVECRLTVLLFSIATQPTTTTTATITSPSNSTQTSAEVTREKYANPNALAPFITYLDDV